MNPETNNIHALIMYLDRQKCVGRNETLHRARCIFTNFPNEANSQKNKYPTGDSTSEE